MRYLIVIILFLSIVSCKKDDGKVTAYPTAGDYYPLTIGNQYIYKVDSIHFSDFDKNNPSDTFYYQLKEVVVDTFTDLEGRMAYRLERYKKFYKLTQNPDTIAWGKKNIWWVVKENNSINRVEENVEIINLMSPVKTGFEWDGNARNFKQKWSFSYKDIGNAIGSYSNTIKILQRENIDELSHEYYEEKYAKGIGMISKNYIDVESQGIGTGKPVIDRIEKGVIVNQELIDYTIK